MHEINHLIGTCGESHPSLISILLGSLGATGFGVWLRYKYNQVKTFIRK